MATVRNVAAGEALTVDYGYDLGAAPRWYQEAWVREQRRRRGIPDLRTALRREAEAKRRESQVIKALGEEEEAPAPDDLTPLSKKGSFHQGYDLHLPKNESVLVL